MVERVLGVLGFALVLAMVSTSAFAFVPISVPEPASISLFAAGGAAIIGTYLIRKWTKRK